MSRRKAIYASLGILLAIAALGWSLQGPVESVVRQASGPAATTAIASPEVPAYPSVPSTWQVPAGAKTAQVSPPAVPQPYDAAQLDPRVTQSTIASTIAVKGYTKTVRPPSSVTGRIKSLLMRQHGYTDSPSDYELDHFLPLECGGSSNLSNLWLEPIGDARLKDKDENRAHSMVVSGVWTLAQGQQYIRDHWTIHYR